MCAHILLMVISLDNLVQQEGLLIGNSYHLELKANALQLSDRSGSDLEAQAR